MASVSRASTIICIFSTGKAPRKATKYKGAQRSVGGDSAVAGKYLMEKSKLDVGMVLCRTLLLLLHMGHDFSLKDLAAYRLWRVAHGMWHMMYVGWLH